MRAVPDVAWSMPRRMQRRGLPGAVCAKERGNPTGVSLEAHGIENTARTMSFGQAVDRYHADYRARCPPYSTPNPGWIFCFRLRPYSDVIRRFAY